MKVVNLSILITLSVLLGACANTETLTAEAAHFGVPRSLLLSAESAGYSPRLRHGKTEFSIRQSHLPYIPQQQCFDTSAMQGWLQQQARSPPPSTMGYTRSPDCPMFGFGRKRQYAQRASLVGHLADPQ